MLAKNGNNAHGVIGWFTDNIAQLSLWLIVYNGLIIPYALLMIDGVLLCGLCDRIYGMCVLYGIY